MPRSNRDSSHHLSPVLSLYMKCNSIRRTSCSIPLLCWIGSTGHCSTCSRALDLFLSREYKKICVRNQSFGTMIVNIEQCNFAYHHQRSPHLHHSNQDSTALHYNRRGPEDTVPCNYHTNTPQRISCSNFALY